MTKEQPIDYGEPPYNSYEPHVNSRLRIIFNAPGDPPEDVRKSEWKRALDLRLEKARTVGSAIYKRFDTDQVKSEPNISALPLGTLGAETINLPTTIATRRQALRFVQDATMLSDDDCVRTGHLLTPQQLEDFHTFARATAEGFGMQALKAYDYYLAVPALYTAYLPDARFSYMKHEDPASKIRSLLQEDGALEDVAVLVSGLLTTLESVKIPDRPSEGFLSHLASL